MENNKRIKSICLDFPNSDCGDAIYYCAGKKIIGAEEIVTEIKRCSKYTEYCVVDFFEIWCGKKLFAEMHQYGHIQYFIE